MTERGAARQSTSESSLPKREKRQVKTPPNNFNYYRYNIPNNRYLYRPVYAVCRCPNNSVECVPSYAPPENGEVPSCICFYEPLKRTAWPCFHHSFWHLTWCSNCTLSGRCTVAELPKPYTPDDDRLFTNIQPCICQNVTKHCIATLDQRFDDLWELQPPAPVETTTLGTTTEEATLPTTTVDNFEEAQGFEVSSLYVYLFQKSGLLFNLYLQ